MLESLLRVLAFCVGFLLVVSSLSAAITTFLLPRPAAPKITRAVFRALRHVFNLLCRLAADYAARDRIMALYTPVGLILLVPVLMVVVATGFMLMFFGVGIPTLYEAFIVSGSSLLTLGFVTVNTPVQYVLAFAEAIIGPVLIALLISYLPTIYGTFQRRELPVSKLETAAGSPPSAVTLIERYFLVAGLSTNQHMQDAYTQLWSQWTDWFTDLEESHTSLAMVAFLRSQQPNRSWITSAGAVLDAAALVRSTLDIPRDTRADLMIRAGYLALRLIAKPYGFRYEKSASFPATPISVTRAEFDAAYLRWQKVGVPLLPNRDQCWQDFAGWRVNYDAPLLDLCALIMSPEAPWSGDRASGRWYLTPNYTGRNLVIDSETSAEANSEDALPDA